MENSLIVIIFIASVIYKIYTNYRKETEKAKKRVPQQRPPIPAFEIEDKAVYTQQTAPVYTQEKNYYNQIENEVPIEVKKVMDYKKQTQSNHLSTPTDTEDKDQQYPFDLKQAILQNAILERPYK